MAPRLQVQLNPSAVCQAVAGITICNTMNRTLSGIKTVNAKCARFFLREIKEVEKNVHEPNLKPNDSSQFCVFIM